MNISGNYYFHDLFNLDYTGQGDKCASEGCKYGWLYDRLSRDCKKYGCLNNSIGLSSDGYLSATSSAHDDGLAWNIRSIGHIVAYGTNDTSSGVRPVIEVLKESLTKK